ncbi:MAG: hypothetical protein ACREIY_04170 [Candidatus Rokuibacteriota bacterium]
MTDTELCFTPATELVSLIRRHKVSPLAGLHEIVFTRRGAVMAARHAEKPNKWRHVMQDNLVKNIDRRPAPSRSSTPSSAFPRSPCPAASRAPAYPPDSRLPAAGEMT